MPQSHVAVDSDASNTLLIVPGLGNSGPGHWQTWLEYQCACTVRVDQCDWNVPDLERWSTRVRECLDLTPGPVWLVAHSFGCLASVQAAASRADRIAGAFLVAPADPERVGSAGRLFSGRLPFPSLLIASTTDPWLTPDAAKLWASRWGSRLIDLGAAGHINVDSGYGPWPEGLALLRRFQGFSRRPPGDAFDDPAWPDLGRIANRSRALIVRDRE